jgi:hypothetical protein
LHEHPWRKEVTAVARLCRSAAHDAPAHAREPAGRKGRIREHPHAQRDVDARADEVDIAVVEDEFDSWQE